MAAFSATLSTCLPKEASDARDDYYVEISHIATPIPPRHQLLQLLQQGDWQDAVVLWGRRPIVVASTVPCVDAEEMRAILSAFETGRDVIIARGLFFQRQRYGVSCHDPPLLYGNRGTIDDTEGLVVVKGRQVGTGEDTVFIVTYRPPLLSAYVVPRVIEFSRRFLGFLPFKQPPPSDLSLQRNTTSRVASVAAGVIISNATTSLKREQQALNAKQRPYSPGRMHFELVLHATVSQRAITRILGTHVPAQKGIGKTTYVGSCVRVPVHVIAACGNRLAL